jgi:MFS family permease
LARPCSFATSKVEEWRAIDLANLRRWRMLNLERVIKTGNVPAIVWTTPQGREELGVVGWLSDRAGRENTMLIAFLLEGIGIFALFWFARDPTMFVLLSGLVYFAWGQIFALFPAACTDIYGKKFATTNYSMLYTAKGTAALLVPLGNVLTAATGSWTAVFMAASALNIVAAILAFVLLKPMRVRMIGRESFPA